MQFDLFSRTSLFHCKVSLPQNAGPLCKPWRSWELKGLTKIWKVKKTPYGFALLDMPKLLLAAGSFLHPFTRSCIEGYIKTVILSKSSELVFNVVKKHLPKETSYHYYGTLSKYFEMTAKLGGVSIILETFICQFFFIKSVYGMIILVTLWIFFFRNYLLFIHQAKNITSHFFPWT